MLSKIVKTIDFNELGGQSLSFKYPQTEWWIIIIIPIITVNSLHYNLFQSVMWAQQP